MRSRPLSAAALVFRSVHTVIALGFLAAIGEVWWRALSDRRNRWLRPAVAALVVEGAAVTANGGDCPLGPLQDRLGDPTPLFKLALSPAAARRAVPTLGLITAAGLLVLAGRKASSGGSGDRSPQMSERDIGEAPTRQSSRRIFSAATSSGCSVTA